MNYFTLIAIAGALVASPALSAQKTAPRLMPIKTADATVKSNGLVKNIAAANKAAEDGTMLPAKQTVSVYDEGEWIVDANISNFYDAQGNVTRYLEETPEDETISQVTMTYDSYGNKTSQITSISTDGGNTWTPRERRIWEFSDPQLHDLNTLLEIYYYQNNEWVISTGNKFEVIRNAAGNVTNFNVFVWYDGKYDNTVKIELTYPEGKQEPDTWSISNMRYDYSTNEYYWEEGSELKDIVWEACNGQIAVTDFKKLFAGDNKIKSAQLYEEGELFYDIAAEYPNAKDCIIVSSYSDPEEGMSGKETVSVTYTDEFGSFTEKSIAEYVYDEDPEYVMTEGEITEVVCDEHGNIISETYIMVEDDMEELMGMMTYDYTYGDNDEVLEEITSEFDFDLEDMLPVQKIENTEFTVLGICTGIDNVLSNASTGCSVEGSTLSVAATGASTVKVYSVTGAEVIAASGNGSFNVDLSSLTSGLYIATVNNNGNTTSVKFTR